MASKNYRVGWDAGERGGATVFERTGKPRMVDGEYLKGFAARRAAVTGAFDSARGKRSTLVDRLSAEDRASLAQIGMRLRRIARDQGGLPEPPREDPYKESKRHTSAYAGRDAEQPTVEGSLLEEPEGSGHALDLDAFLRSKLSASDYDHFMRLRAEDRGRPVMDEAGWRERCRRRWESGRISSSDFAAAMERGPATPSGSAASFAKRFAVERLLATDEASTAGIGAHIRHK